MARIFLSHSSANNAEAVVLRDWLTREGWDDLFLDLDPNRGIAAGERWERALNEAASRCEVVIFLVSKAWLASRWCLKELNLAHRLGKRLFGVLIEDLPRADLPPDLTGTWQIVRLASGRDHVMLRATLPQADGEVHVTFSAEGLARLKAGLQKAGLDAKYFAWPPANDSDRPPYRGLRPLEAEDAGIFFGRDGPIVETLDRLRSLGKGPPPRLLVILGASGAGKSSFLRAGLIPRLTRDDRHFLVLPVVRPQRAAFTGETGLVACLEAALKLRGVAFTRAKVKTALDGGAESLRPLLNALCQAAQPPRADDEEASPVPTLILSVDQSEELFLPEGAVEAQAFLTLMRDLTASDAPAVMVLFTIRSDNYERLQLAKPLEGVRQQPFSLAPMPKGAYAEVIKAPARRLDGTPRALKLEEQLVDALLADVESGAGKDALPLLAFTLERLYLEHGGDGDLRLVEYEQLGRVRGSIEAAIERALVAADADPAIPKERASRLALLRRGLIPWLANIDPDTSEPRRRVARLSELPPEAVPLIRQLIEVRLLATDAARDSGEVTVEPAHEAILRQWGLLQAWLTEDFEDLTALEGVKRAARDWADNDRNQEWIAHAGGRLEEAERVAAREDFARNVDQTERAYLAACRAAAEAARKDREAQLAARERAQRRARVATIGVLIIAVATLAGALYQKRQTDKRETLVLTSAADRAIADERYDAAMRIALQGVPLPDRSPLALGWSAPEVKGLEGKLAAAAQLSSLVREIHGHADTVNSVAFSSDGTRLVSASADKTVRVWDAASGLMLRQLLHDGDVKSAAFSPDGSRIITVTGFKALLWNAESGEFLQDFSARRAPGSRRRYLFGIAGAAFSADNTRILLAGRSGMVTLRDAASGDVVTEFESRGGEAKGVASSPDGQRVVLAADEDAWLWDLTGSRPVAQQLRHGGAVNGAAFSSDGARVVTAASDGVARVWDTANGQMIRELRGHNGALYAAAFSADRQRVITASADGTMRVWDSSAASREFRGHGDEVRSAAFAPDGTRVATASSDRTIRIWDTAGGGMARVLRHGNDLQSAAFSADGTRVASASFAQTARIWNAATGEMLRELRHEAAVSDTGFSDDQKLIFTLSLPQGTLKLWEVETGAFLRDIRDEKGIYGAAFIDAARIAVVSGSRAAIWDANSGKLLHELGGHRGGFGSPDVSLDGKQIVTSTSEKARIWDVETGALVREINIESTDGSLAKAALSPDRTRIVTANGRSARVWNVASGAMLNEFKGHRAPLWSVAFSPDGARIITASNDQTARVWDAATGEMLREFSGHSREVRTARFSRDGKLIVTASKDGTARVWDVGWINVRGEELVRRVCAGKLAGAQTFTLHDVTDPILAGLAGTWPCERRGPLSAAYWRDLGRSTFGWIKQRISG